MNEPDLVTSESDIFMLILEFPDAKTVEWCPDCESEVEIRAYGLSHCPECGTVLKPCSMCDTSRFLRCNSCPYDRKVKA